LPEDGLGVVRPVLAHVDALAQVVRRQINEYLGKEFRKRQDDVGSTFGLHNQTGEGKLIGETRKKREKVD